MHSQVPPDFYSKHHRRVSKFQQYQTGTADGLAAKCFEFLSFERELAHFFGSRCEFLGAPFWREKWLRRTKVRSWRTLDNGLAPPRWAAGPPARPQGPQGASPQPRPPDSPSQRGVAKALTKIISRFDILTDHLEIGPGHRAPGPAGRRGPAPAGRGPAGRRMGRAVGTRYCSQVLDCIINYRAS